MVGTFSGFLTRRPRSFGSVFGLFLACSLFTGPAAAEKVAPDADVSFLLLPYFENDPLFDDGRELVNQLVVAEFRRHGIAVTKIDQSEHADDWTAALDEVGGLFPPGRHFVSDDRASRLLESLYRRMGAEHAYDGLIAPAFITTPVMIIDGKGRWDGVSRRVRVKGRRGSLKGLVNGISLRLTRLDRVAEIKLSSGVGGLVVPFYVDTIKMENVQRDDMFEETGSLKEGVEIAVKKVLEGPPLK